MVIKVYVSGISGNKEVKKRQQRVLLILDSKNVKYEVIDIAEPGAEEAKDFMHNTSTANGATISDPNPRHPLPPQIFNEDEYCGDYDQFDMANEIDEMEKFLKLEIPSADEALISNAEIQLKNGEAAPKEDQGEKVDQNELKENEVPNDQAEAEEKSNDGEVKESEEQKEESVAEEEVKEEAAKEEEEKVEAEQEVGAGDEQVENGKEAETAKEEQNPEEKSDVA